MQINRVGVVGAGIMGSGIAQVVAQAGYQVVLQDVDADVLARAAVAIRKSLERLVEKGKITQEHLEATLSSIQHTTELERIGDSDLVIEAVFEDLEVKQAVFKKLDTLCRQATILATNTSSLPVTSIAAATRRPAQVLGLHFMNPVPLMQGVEVIQGRLTREEVMEAGIAFVKSLGKVPVRAVDYAGFIVSRVLDAMLNEAVRCVMDGNRPEDVDTAMKVCCNFPMGPLELIDLTGADIVLHGIETMHGEFGDRFCPAPLLRQMVRGGQLGRKAGQGFYAHPQGK